MRPIGRPPGSRALRRNALTPKDNEIDLYAKRVGQIVRDARMERGISAIRLAQAIGAHPRTMYRLEAGDRSPLLETLIRIARALGIAPRELLP
jgi:ribosome-binding protein aMBF1 (putative translation factor)